ncbi:MAG TPA: hypothetical protein VLU46_02295 [Thermoanaerobaculia bacterium]|nr:hypothetical protein [Thermoanaerobaculia bacterium]
MVRTAFIVLALIAIVPIWSVHYLPTGDGPCHLYNAWVMNRLVTGHAPQPVASWYRIDWRPHPNWIGHAALALLMFVVPPLVAEKILVTAIVLTFFAGAWVLTGAVDERCRAYAFVAFPLAFNMPLQAGFYNFAASTALFLLVLGFWWRRRDDPSPRTIAVVAALLVLCYFSHPMGVALAIGSIGVLWLITLRGRPFTRHLRHLSAFVPAIALLLWFVHVRGSGSEANTQNFRDLLIYLSRTQVIFSFDLHQLTIGYVLTAILVILIVATAIRQRFPLRLREADGFFLLFLIFLGLYFFAPGAVAGGSLVTERMALFVTLIVIPWFSPELPSVVRRGVIIAFAIIAIVNTSYLVRRYRKFDRTMRDYLYAVERIPSNKVVLPLLQTRETRGSFISVITHAIDYVAIDKQLVDLDNYEPGTDYFPVAWSSDAQRPDIYEIEAEPDDVDLATYAPATDVVFTWRMPADEAADIEPFYDLLDARGDGRVYVRKAGVEAKSTIILPLAATAGPQWRVDQEIRNNGTEDAEVFVNGKPVEIAAGASVRVPNQEKPYVRVQVDRHVAPQITATTTLRREGTQFSASLPAVRESDLRPSPLTIANVALASPLHLRVWTFRAQPYTVTFAGKTQSFVTGSDGYQMVPLDVHGGRGDITVTAADPKTKLWAFASSGDPPTLFFP